MPGFGVSVFTALVPVVLMAASAIAKLALDQSSPVAVALEFLGQPDMALTISVAIAVYTFGLARGKKMDEIMNTGKDAILAIAVILLIVGAGGAATAILVQAALDGVREIAVFNRQDEFFPKAEKVVAQLNEQTECKVTLYDLADHPSLKRELDSSDIYIDGTSCGMKPLEGVVAIPDKSYLHKELVVMDTVYAPRQTELMRWADEVGCKNFNGLGMMLYQGAEAFKLWTGKDMPVDFIRDVLF